MNPFPSKNRHFLSSISQVLYRLESRTSHDTLSMIYAMISTVFCYINVLHAKSMTSKYSPFQLGQIVLFFNTLIAVFISSVDSSLSFSVPDSRSFKLLVVRNTIAVISQLLCFYYLSQFIPISLINVIYGSTPVMCFLIEWRVYSIPLKAEEIIGSLSSFLGIFLVLDLFGWSKETSTTSKISDIERIKYCLICLLACGGFAVSNVLMRELRKVNILAILFNFHFIGAVYLAFAMMYSGAGIKEIELWDLIRILIFNAFFNFLFMISFMRALQLGKKGRVTVINNLQLVYSFFVEIVFFNEPPSSIRILGSVILIGGVALCVL